jgi:hypothetical protein
VLTSRTSGGRWLRGLGPTVLALHSQVYDRRPGSGENVLLSKVCGVSGSWFLRPFGFRLKQA